MYHGKSAGMLSKKLVAKLLQLLGEFNLLVCLFVCLFVFSLFKVDFS